MMLSSKRTIGISCALAIVLSASACSVEDDSGHDGIEIALSAGLDRLDPQTSANGPDLDVMAQIYETLLTMDPETSELRPHLAESYELVEDNVWRFTLREDVSFSNGEPFNADAVKFSIERILDPETASSSAAQLESVDEVVVVDEHTVDIVTDGPDPVLPRRMQPIGGSGRVFIVPPEHFSEHSLEEVAEDPVGTGPYVMEEWNKGQYVQLAANEDYWGEPPEVPAARYSFLTENSTRVNALVSGEVDLIQRVPTPEIGRVEESDGVHVESSPDGLVHTILLDMRNEPFDDIKVRQAFAHAIDVQGFVDELLQGYGRELAVPLGPNVLQYDDSLEPYEYDPDRAKELLEEAGYDEPLTIETNTSDGRYVADREIYDAMNSQLDAVGFDIRPTTVEWGRLINMMTSGDGGPFYIIGWDFGEADASKQDSFLQSGAGSSIADLPEYDDLSKKASSETDEAENDRLWKEAQKVVYDNYAVAGVWQAESVYAMSDELVWSPAFGENLRLDEITYAE